MDQATRLHMLALNFFRIIRGITLRDNATSEIDNARDLWCYRSTPGVTATWSQSIRASKLNTCTVRVWYSCCYYMTEANDSLVDQHGWKTDPCD
jgi:hypothetical protein